MNINLKIEDKILLGIGGVFLISILFFVSFSGKMFGILEQRVSANDTFVAKKENMAKEEDPIKAFDEIFEKSFNEGRAAFDQLQQTFDENRRKRQEAFKKTEENFKTRFEEARDKFMEKPL